MGFTSGFQFLGIGIPELFFILILALVILGPERLPGVAKEIVKGFFRMRNLSKDLTGQLEQELGMEELKELRELKGMKAGGIVEAWANDELDLNLDEEENQEDASKSESRQASKPKKKNATSAVKSSKSQPKAKEVRKSTEPEAKDASTQAEDASDTTPLSKVDMSNVIGAGVMTGSSTESSSPSEGDEDSAPAAERNSLPDPVQEEAEPKPDPATAA